MAGEKSALLRQARPTSMEGGGSRRLIVSMRRPSRDQRRCTMSERMATPLPLATSERTASMGEVLSLIFG